MSRSDAAIPAARAGRPGRAGERRAAPADLRLVPAAAAAWAAAALALDAPGRPVALGVVGCLLAAGAVLLWRLHRPGRRLAAAVAMALLCAAAGGAVAGLHAAAARAGPLPGLAGQRVDVEVEVTGDPVLAARRAGAAGDAPRPVLLPAQVVRLHTADGGVRSLRGRVLVVAQGERAAPWLSLLPSTRLRTTARAAPPMPGRAWELASVLRVREAGPPAVTGGPSAVQRFAGRLRAGLREAAADLPGDARVLLPALVIGDDSGVPADLEEAVQATGLTHLVAVSGSQVAIVLGLLIGSPGTASRAERGGLAARLGIPLRSTALVGGVLVVGFVLVCRPDPSVLRAAVCAGILLLALATGRRRSLLPALAAAALLLILYDPSLARSFGFLLSVLATGALLTVAPVWSLALRRRGVPRRPAEALAAAGAAQLVCAPVVTVFAETTSLVAIPCNLLAGLAVAPVIVLGWAAMALALPAPGAAEALTLIASWPVRWIAAVARTGAALPGAELDWPGGWWGAVLLAGATVAAVALARRLPGRPVTAAVCVLLLLLAVLRPPPLVRVLTGWPPPGWRVVACDVGQGDALVLAAGPGRALVVDAGPEPAAVDRCLRDLGVREVPLVILSHYHADHVGGLSGVLRGRSVGAVQTTAVRDPPEQAEFVARAAADAGVPVLTAVPGERRRLGEGLSWEVLWPPAGAGAAGLGANDASVTLLVRAGELTVFLPGDLEPPAQERLLAERPGLPRVDVLKVAHHGSAAQHQPLLDRLRPRIALVSCGADNRYGHPAPRTLAALSRAGAAVLRTDAHGPLAVASTAEGPRGIAREAPM
ncbi:ComEC/Rec2 family competence protein [Streptomyces johnsoniae]|uniref:ComEC/Rec2 family competence protein n=1 Tax=Streptomyces johnsoniae TaxID=3075532 RepID=A0ABU2S4U9_9ACTN|nr:ComEC/Rec2 family competence protein [Streptomyces sp. DSM 41886]MDT0444009.1 ComEC/Rec2 family competence protein [Streptomyces sp. DSM 41886]